MATGLAPIVTSCPGNDLLVRDMETGLSFPIGDGDGLTERLATLLADAELRQQLGRKATALVWRDYSTTSVAAATRTLYDSLT